MPGRGEALRLGPFTGGLNLASDPSAVADTEVVECVNFELDIDGSLVTRPAIHELLMVTDRTPNGLTIIGQGVFTGGTYLIGSTDRPGFEGTYWMRSGFSDWQLLQSQLISSVAIQHGGYVWIVPTPGSKAIQPGGRWDPSGGFVADTNMPEGDAALFHKSRMFIVPGPNAGTNESRLRFTDPITSSTLSWTASNLIDVSPGDGQNLVDIIVVNDNLMLFKHDSTYILAYDVNPSDAILRSINGTIGATTKYCVQAYENSVFVFHQGSVYEIVNYDFTKINYKVPFELDTTIPTNFDRLIEVFLSVLGDRLIVGYFAKRYIYNMKTRTWSEWQSSAYQLHHFGPIWAMPTNAPAVDNPIHFTCPVISNFDSVFDDCRTLRITPKVWTQPESYFPNGSNGPEDITLVTVNAHVKTKNYDLADSHHFKKLHWWGADLLSSGNVTGTVNPVTAVTAVSWSLLSEVTWGSRTTFTWNQPNTQTVNVATEVNHDQIPTRVFVKFLRALRFRQINFEVDLESDASEADGPPRLFSITAIVSSKQTVPKQVN